MQLAAAARPVGEQALEELHAGCDDQGGVPILGAAGGGLAVGLVVVYVPRRLGQAVVLEDLRGVWAEPEGLADHPGVLIEDAQVRGSPRFLSPEQALGRPDVDARCNLYGLGGVAYYLITGRPPFERQTVMETLLAHARDPVVPVSAVRAGVPADLETVIMRCLEKDPGQRFPDAESLGRALAACACAGRWTQDRAAAWWAKHSSEPPPASILPDPGNEATVTLLGRQQPAR
jgi:serine/threonine protein kinase